ncbi:pyridoxal phosphate-dependent decarboxylase family protein [Occallatibacter riparius]|uniref:Pyridoxal-dependent decarboxylase n=1 Tax=Occallatibacter riparius TaxID=1002689 RepID=A0A9J7BTX8_9BACT|nr:pyridoxal-dependent decarboxylase [Occallatibacter riparius]UWZ86332.1 pyridoxal-dependent decarboxylase [Occallatibacter riparius]
MADTLTGLTTFTDHARILEHAKNAAVEYLNGVHNRSIAPAAAAIAALDQLGGPVPESPSDPDAVLALLHQYGSPATIANGGGRYFGFVNGGCVPAAMAAGWMVNAWDQNAAMHVQSPAAVGIEEIAIEWVRQLLGLPDGTAGAVVTGATMANFCSLAAARHALLERAGWDAENDGLYGAPELTVVVGEEAHSSVIKALGMLGLGRRRVLRVPVDGEGRMRADALPHLNERTILVLQAGNVNTGAFDPAAAICPEARAAGAWIHVDGAFGLWAAASPKYAHLTHGYDMADSWATDAHKWPNVGYDCGIALLREPAALRGAMEVKAAYLHPVEEVREPVHYNPELSRRARGVELWAGLRSLGRAGIAEIVERTSRHASHFAEGLRAAGFRVLNKVAINQVLVDFGSAEKTLRTVAALQEEGTCWCGSTVWQGHTAMRISVSSWATTDEDVERSLAAMIAAGR